MAIEDQNCTDLRIRCIVFLMCFFHQLLLVVSVDCFLQPMVFSISCACQFAQCLSKPLYPCSDGGDGHPSHAIAYTTIPNIIAPPPSPPMKLITAAIHCSPAITAPLDCHALHKPRSMAAPFLDVWCS
ncbi:hypothetical protein OROMI_014663 [Orobanche minor]